MNAVEPRADETVIVGTFSTFTVWESQVVLVRTQFCGSYFFNIFNLGPCTVYYRDDADPTVGDPQAVMLPPGCADNQVLIGDGEAGLRFVAGPPCGAGAIGLPPCREQEPDDDVDDPDCRRRARATITLRVTVAG